LHASAMNGYTSVVQLLLDKAALPSVLANQCDPLNRSPLFFASRAGRISVVQVLLAAGAEQDTADWKGWTPLSAAVQCGYPGVASLLRGAKAST
ncbi:ankyrin repeat protein, partial [Plectosphaerella cucumerina]